MGDDKTKQPRRRILETAITLFAQKGFDAVGVREIAKHAEVNISMISYYFEGKIGILKAIIEEFHNKYFEVISQVLSRSLTQEQVVRQLVTQIVNFIRENTNLTMVTIHSLPLDIPEIAALKTDRVNKLIDGIGELVRQYGLDPDNKGVFAIVGPAIISSILAHFRFKPVQKNILQIEFDDAFYDRYIDTLTTFFLYGLKGIIEKYQPAKGDNFENHC
ncbi:MAG TPA: TetR/AcrR family transcriptional regulator [bacterium]|nr:TetR/AcrR family transcriptional regulator [bacterium]